MKTTETAAFCCEKKAKGLSYGRIGQLLDPPRTGDQVRSIVRAAMSRKPGKSTKFKSVYGPTVEPDFRWMDAEFQRAVRLAHPELRAINDKIKQRTA